MVKNPTAVRETWVQSLCWEDSLEEGLTTYSSILAWRIPWIEETGGLQSVESQRAGHNWATFTHFTLGSSGKEPSCQSRGCKRCEFDPWARKMPWRRAWQLTPVFLPGESHGQRSLTSYGPWGHNWSDLACMHTGGEFEKSFSWHAVLKECTRGEIPYICVCVCMCISVAVLPSELSFHPALEFSLVKKPILSLRKCFTTSHPQWVLERPVL